MITFLFSTETYLKENLGPFDAQIWGTIATKLLANLVEWNLWIGGKEFGWCDSNCLNQVVCKWVEDAKWV